MARIRITDLSVNTKITDEEMHEILGGVSYIRLDRPSLGSSGRGFFYELIPAAFDKAIISKTGEVHAADFDYSSKSQREFTKAILWPS